jgi:hypothetical protein
MTHTFFEMILLVDRPIHVVSRCCSNGGLIIERPGLRVDPNGGQAGKLATVNFGLWSAGSGAFQAQSRFVPERFQGASTPRGHTKKAIFCDFRPPGAWVLLSRTPKSALRFWQNQGISLGIIFGFPGAKNRAGRVAE